MPFQGTSADIIKMAMIKIASRLETEKSQFSDLDMLLQVHDELVFECPKELLKESAAMIKEEMQGIIKMKVPLLVDIEVGKNWLEMEELK
jgi:DNA polymerase-1